MASNALFFGWNRSIPGRERISEQHFGEFVEYLTGLQQQGTIQSFDATFLNPHGGDMNGFFLIRGESADLSAVMSTEEWMVHMTRAAMHLDGAGAVRGATGDMVMARMAIWGDAIPE